MRPTTKQITCTLSCLNLNDGTETTTTRVDILPVFLETVAAHAGYAKEIDHALERIARIEHHLSIKPKTAASL